MVGSGCRGSFSARRSCKVTDLMIDRGPLNNGGALCWGILLLAAAIYLVVKSPKKLQTLGRMAIAFVATLALIIVPGAILRMGDPQAWGKLGGLLALLIAVIVGWWHTRSLKRAGLSRTTEARRHSAAAKQQIERLKYITPYLIHDGLGVYTPSRGFSFRTKMSSCVGSDSHSMAMVVTG